MNTTLEIIGGISWQGFQHTAHGDLYPLDDFDRAEYKHVDLKDGEELYRYKTDIMFNYGPVLIKVNADKGLIYFLRENELDRAWFNTKGTKARVKIY
jgi:hypothetical protein